MPIVLNGSGPITGVTSLNTTVSDTEIGYLDGVTSAIQSQINTAGGLVKITDSSFSAVSAVNVNNCFTTTYENYLIVLNVTAVAAGSVAVNLRGRVSGADRTTDTFYGGYLSLAHTGTALTGVAQNAVMQIRIGPISATSSVNRLTSIIQVMSPQSANRTCVSVDSQGYDGSAFVAEKGGVMEFSTTTQLDGFSIYPASSTITGALRVYGFRN